jgi:hypothetical protein
MEKPDDLIALFFNMKRQCEQTQDERKGENDEMVL